jgi:hypothetical protein
MAGVGVVVLALALAGVGRARGWFGGSAAGCERGGPHQQVDPPSAGDAPQVDVPASAVRVLTSNRDRRGSPAAEDDRILRLAL